MEANSGDDVEELPTPVEGQNSRCAEERPAQPIHLGGKKKKGGSLSEMTEVSRARLNRSNDNRPQSGESFVGGDRFSIVRAVAMLNS